jgi:DNA-binding SARP family transcriptional activator
MFPNKIYIFGEKHLKSHDCTSVKDCEFVHLPYNYPTDSLAFLGEAHFIFINLEEEREEEGLNKIYPLRNHFPDTPIVLITLEKQLSFPQIIQSMRDGVTDCLIPPFGVEELSTVLNCYGGEKVGQRNAFSSIFSFFNMGQNQGQGLAFVAPALRPQHPLSINEENTDLFIHFFGILRMTASGQPIGKVAGSKLKSLLAYLLFHKKSCIHRDKLRRCFWQDFSTDSGRNNLNVSITHLRRHFHAVLTSEIISSQNECFTLNPQLNVQSDAHIFLEVYDQAKKMERLGNIEAALNSYKIAAETYMSDFLEDLWHEEWTIPIREDFQEKYITALSFISDNAIQNGLFEPAIEALRQILSKDNCWEEAHRKLMLCYAECGKIDRAIRQFQECERVLREKLDVSPSKATIELFKKLKVKAV